MGPVGPVEIDMKAAFMIMDSMEFSKEEKLDSWNRLQTITNTLLNALKEEADKKARAKKGQHKGY